jgi:hypothetical protein
MSFFRDRNALPRNISPMMERFGRHEFDVMNSSDDGVAVFNETQQPLLAFAGSDPDGLVEALANAVCPVGGWAAFGGARTVWNLLTPSFEHPAYDRLMDASIGFLRENGVPPNRVAGYDWQHWIARGGTIETWLPLRPLPTAEQAPITPLRPGEVRPVARLTEASDSNVILVRLDEKSVYRQVVDARYSDEDPRRVRNEYESAPSLRELYIKIANTLQTPPPWHDPQLGMYFPLPRPRI